MSNISVNINELLFADVILPLAVPKLLTYHFKKELNLLVGQRVVVNVGKQKKISAVVYAVHHNKPKYNTKEVVEKLDIQPIVNPNLLTLWSWISRYYMTTMGEVMIAG